MKKSIPRSLAALAAAVALAAAPVASLAAAADYELKIVFLGSQDDEDYDGSVVFKDFVESRSNGRVAVEIYPGATLCANARECVEQVESGIADIHITTIGGAAAIFPPVEVLDIPYMFPDDRVAECVFDGPFTRTLRDAILADGRSMRLMMVGNTGGWRNFVTTTKQIKTPGDVRGLKLRTISAEVQQEMVKALGATPTPIAWPEVYTSLATGVVEGTKNGITDIVGMKFHEHAKFMTLDGHAYMGALWFMNNDKFQGMDDDLKRVVADGFHFMKHTTRVLPMRRQADAYAAFREAGGSIYVPTAAEKKAFQAAVKPVEQWYVDKYGDRWLRELRGAIAACEQAVAGARSAEVN